MMPDPGYLFDLHLHTNYSDGRPSPEEVVRHCAGARLAAIAITDHENANGMRAAAPFARRLEIELIPGIEFSCRWEGGRKFGINESDIDLLGYFFNPEDPAFMSLENAALEDLHHRIGACCERISQAGYPIHMEEVLEQNPHYGGAMALIDALVKKGLAPDWRAASLLFETHWSKVSSNWLTIQQAIHAIHAAGGVAVLAHPSVIRTYRGWLRARPIAELVKAGLDGLEIYHPRLTEEARKHFTALAVRFHLLVTGGSDEHGWPEGFPRLGSQPVTISMVESLRERSRHYRSAIEE